MKKILLGSLLFVFSLVWLVYADIIIDSMVDWEFQLEQQDCAKKWWKYRSGDWRSSDPPVYMPSHCFGIDVVKDAEFEVEYGVDSSENVIENSVPVGNNAKYIIIVLLLWWLIGLIAKNTFNNRV